MRILIAGSSGMIGSALIPALQNAGHQIIRLVREESQIGPDRYLWDPATGVLDRASLQGTQAVINLAGENLGNGRWTDEKKKKIRDSRVQSTMLLSHALRKMNEAPEVFLSASGVGIYGDRGKERLTEESPSGGGFIAEICRQWEEATEPAAERGIRVGHLRMGMVLSTKGGALPKMLTPFKLGLGGRAGSGAQYWSWITLQDVIGAIQHCLAKPELSGPILLASPNPVTNREFTQTLAQILGRPSFLSLPRFAARLAFGEMAEELLMASARVEPTKLKASCYPYFHPELTSALKHLLQK
jgi:uncharacterized protein